MIQSFQVSWPLWHKAGAGFQLLARFQAKPLLGTALIQKHHQPSLFIGTPELVVAWHGGWEWRSDTAWGWRSDTEGGGEGLTRSGGEGLTRRGWELRCVVHQPGLAALLFFFLRLQFSFLMLLKFFWELYTCVQCFLRTSYMHAVFFENIIHSHSIFENIIHAHSVFWDLHTFTHCSLRPSYMHAVFSETFIHTHSVSLQPTPHFFVLQHPPGLCFIFLKTSCFLKIN